MGVSNKDGAKIWHCFKASCGIRGSENIGRTLNSIRERLRESPSDVKRPLVGIPPNLSNPRHHEAAMRYLDSVNSREAFEQGLVDIKYSPAHKRVIYMMPSREGGVGRSLIGEKPKWKNYGDTSGILQIGNGTTAVVVEDAASAASVARLPFCSGCALLGTNISSLQRSQLLHFTKVVIALDKDASRKALKLKSKLEGRVQTSVLLLEDDLKFVEQEALERLLVPLKHED